MIPGNADLSDSDALAQLSAIKAENTSPYSKNHAAEMIDEDTSQQLFTYDLTKAISDSQDIVDTDTPGLFEALQYGQQVAIVDVDFNMGHGTGLPKAGGGFSSLVTFRSDLADGDWDGAAAALQRSGLGKNRKPGDVQLIQDVGNADQSVNIPTDGNPVTISGVIEGKVVTIQVNFSTTDENENYEGEYLSISSSTGLSETDTSYNACSVYTFTVPAGTSGSLPAVAVTATPMDWDGDESAVVTASFELGNDPSFTPAQTSAFSNSSADLDTAATGTATVADAFAADLESGSASYDLGAENAAWATAALQSEAAADFTSLSVDPVDTNYKVIVHPAKTTSTILSTAKNFKGIKTAGPLTASINAKDLSQERGIDLAAAAYATANKLDGAIAAGDVTWTKRQSATLKSYKKQLAALLAAQPLLANREATQLNNAGIGSTTVASTDVNNFEDVVNDDGLPSQLVTDLNSLGVSAATQSQIQQALFAQDIDTASGTYASLLTNASLLSELKQVAALLRAG